MKNSSVDWFFDKHGKWQESFSELREIVLSTHLAEELKWGCPCYTLDGENVVLIHGFKDYCALLFMQGALLKDPQNVMVQQTKNVQSARQMRFTDVGEIIGAKSIIRSYIKEAVQNAKKGLKVEKKETSEYDVPDEFKSALKEMPELKKAFAKLTPGRQRGYLLYFSSAKLAKTRMARVENAIPRILDNKGLDD